MPRMSTSTRRGTACARSRAAAFPRRNCWRPSGWSRRAGSWRWRRPSANRPSGRREGRPLRKGRPFSCRRWTGRGLSPRFGRRPPEGRLSDASGAARRPNPGLAATRCLLRNNATAARPSEPAGYGRCGAVPAPLRASRGARAGPPSGRDAVRRAVRRPWRGSSR